MCPPHAPTGAQRPGSLDSELFWTATSCRTWNLPEAPLPPPHLFQLFLPVRHGCQSHCDVAAAATELVWGANGTGSGLLLHQTVQ